MSNLACTAKVRFFVCRWPDFYETMNPCDLVLYRWIEQMPMDERPYPHTVEMERIFNDTLLAQQQRVNECEASRYAMPASATPGLKLTVATRLSAGKETGHASADNGMDARVAIPFAHSSATSCPPVPYYILHKVSEIGINYYPQHTNVEFLGEPNTLYSGIGPWDGSKVFFVDSLNTIQPWMLQNILSMAARVSSQKIFDHWVAFDAITNPPPPESIIARGQSFNHASLQVITHMFYNDAAPPGQRGHGFKIADEIVHVVSGWSLVQEEWLETDYGWTNIEDGGCGCEIDYVINMPDVLDFYGDMEGIWIHRVVVRDFKRPPTLVEVRYSGMTVGNAVTSITPMATSPYQPGSGAGLAVVEESVAVRTVGASKASFRIISIEPVPGFGVIFTIKVVNELHFDACIVTPFLSGIGDRASWLDNAMHFNMPTVWVVRNLAAHSESDPVSIFVPMNIVEPGNWPLRVMHWGMKITQKAYAAPLNQFSDGIYGHHQASPYPNIGNLPPPAYKASNNPEQYAFLLAGYLENGDKVWNNPWDSTVDINRILVTIPASKAPGADVPYVSDPSLGDSSYPTYSDQVPFLGFFEWTAEYRVSFNPEVWESRSGYSSLGLDLTTAISRYGRTMTLPVAAGRPMWSPYYQKWITVFESWPGGNINELETYLVDTYLRPQFMPEFGWRNFQYTTLKPPYLTTNVAWWFASSSLSDNDSYIHALPLIKETSTTDSVDVVLMGYY